MTATLATFRAAFDFTGFVGVSDEFVTQSLERGNARVEGWEVEADQDHAAMLYAAHTLAMAGLGNGAEAEMAKAGTIGLQSMKSGGLSITRGASSIDGSSLKSTHWGRQYMELARANYVGPRVASA